MKTADAKTELGGCAVDLGVTLKLTLFIVVKSILTSNGRLFFFFFEKATYINNFCGIFFFMRIIT